MLTDEGKFSTSLEFFNSLFDDNFRSNHKLKKFSLQELVKLSGQWLVCYLCMALGDENEQIRSQARHTLRTVESLLMPAGKKDSNEPSARFLMTYALGVISAVSEKISGSKDGITVSTMKKNIRCLGELTVLLQESVDSVISIVG